MTSLAARLRALPLPGDKKRAPKQFADWQRSLSAGDAAALARLNAAHAALEPFLVGVFDGSPFLRDLATRDISRFLRLLQTSPEQSFAALVSRLPLLADPELAEADLMRELRLARQEQALLVALADLGGVWNLTTVTESLSLFAEKAVGTTLDYLLRRAAGKGDIELATSDNPQQACGYFVLGMGKLGGRELNYSSDIDLIAFYEAGKARLRKADEHQAFFVRLTQQLARILSNSDHDGFVFRVDLRLRPDPGTYPLAISTTLACNYYEAVGQNWERAAFIKARVIAGDATAGNAFLKEISPFLWRKYLDYAAIAEIHAMKRLIEESKELNDKSIPGRDLKLGAGGIREIEFFVQTQQLIGGGRNAGLRVNSTMAALEELSRRRWIDEAARHDLARCYEELRRLEHRLQMREDKQTHRLPSSTKELNGFARFAAYADGKELARALGLIVSQVRARYQVLFEAKPDARQTALDALDVSSSEISPQQLRKLKNMGFADPGRLVETVRGWQAGRYPATRSPTARARLADITPRLIEAISASGEAEATLASFDRFLSQLPMGVQFFSLLRSKPAMLDLFTKTLAIAPRLAQDLAHRPHLIDGLIENIDKSAAEAFDEFTSQLQRELAQTVDYAEALDGARRLTQEHIFLGGVRLVAGLLPVSEAGRAYSELAGAVVAALYQRVTDEHALRFGHTPKRASAVIALGRLGSCEMTATSDLDLLVLYEDPHDAMSDGEKQLSAAEYYTRLTQRLVAALSAPTAEGIAYPVDFRLRPSGNKGPLAGSLRAFEEYHAGEAWTWEHMALTRARIVAHTSREFAARLGQIIAGILRRPRPSHLLVKDVADMRALLLKEKPPRDEWDVRFRRGGLIDVEFIGQYLILQHANTHPELLGKNGGQLFVAAAEARLIAKDEAQALRAAVSLYTAIMQLSRLCLETSKSLSDAAPALAGFICRECGVEDLAQLAALINQRTDSVREIFVRRLKP